MRWDKSVISVNIFKLLRSTNFTNSLSENTRGMKYHGLSPEEIKILLTVLQSRDTDLKSISFNKQAQKLLRLGLLYITVNGELVFPSRMYVYVYYFKLNSFVGTATIFYLQLFKKLKLSQKMN